MGKPKVKKGKSGSRNDSVQQKKRKVQGQGDAGFITNRIKKYNKNNNK